KVPVGAMQKIVTTLYGEAVKAGVFEGFVDEKAERSQLLPETAKALPADQQDAAINARMQGNEDFVKLLSQGEGGLPKEIGEHALWMLMDTAKGNLFLEFIKGKLTGADRAHPQPGAGAAGGATETRRAQLRAELAKPEMQPQHPKFDRAAHDALDAEYRKL